MILKIRNSKLVKVFSLGMVFIFLSTLNPMGASALTGGPAQPEFNSFTPIGTSDMVDLASGDFSYNIPLMDVGGFPINLAYNSGVTMDQEASWVGLGWDLSIGQINRQMRGLPDDFDGDEMTYENNIKKNWTVGGTFQFSPEVLGIKILKNDLGKAGESKIQLSIGLSAQYNSYTGIGLSPSAGITFDLAKMGSVGLNATSTPDGLVISPSVSLNPRIVKGKIRAGSLGVSFGTSFNSRQGLTSVNMSTSMCPGIESNKDFKKRMTIAGSSKSFVPNTFTPRIEANMISVSSTFNGAFGTETIGLEGEAEITGFRSEQYLEETKEDKKAYGYEHTHKAPKEAILDFNREKDGNFSVNSTNLPITNYTYDLYSVQGQGVGGMFQPFRSQVGYVYDNHTFTTSTDVSGGVEIGVGNAVHNGGDIETSFTRSRVGIWENDNHAIENGIFDDDHSMEPLNYEEVYFKHVGDLSADQDMDMYSNTNLRGYNPIQLSIDGGVFARELNQEYLTKGESLGGGAPINKEAIKRSQRVKRNQNILKIPVSDVDSLPSFIKAEGPYVKPHHTAGFIVTRDDGARYNYGKALYNTTKREASFALGSGIGASGITKEVGITSIGLIHFDEGVDNSVNNKHGDHYFNRITTPAYAHTFLLTSLVSTDYSDIDGIEGPSDGDLGSYTKFEYRDMGTYHWRVPYAAETASFNEGLKTDPTDDKGSYIYGSKETSYIQKIETKTHVALFHVSPRNDGYGVNSEAGNAAHTVTNSVMYKLDKVELYSKGEFYKEGVITTEGGVAEFYNIETDATPIKTVHFEYDYSLCPDIINNDQLSDDPYGKGNINIDFGKLTLKKVYFTYRNSGMGKYAPYDFSYGDADHSGGELSVEEENKRNPGYNLKGYDIWGNYKNNEVSLDGNTLDPLSAPEFNYVEQNTAAERALVDHHVAAWSITDIGLPSGGKIQVDYEADDYQYVQNKKAMRMFKLAGAGNSAFVSESDFEFDPTEQTNDEALLYNGNEHITHLYFELDGEDQEGIGLDEFRNKYLMDIYNSQNRLLQFRMLLNMTHKGGKNSGSWEDQPFDYVSGYAELDNITECQIFNHGGVWYGSVGLQEVKMEGGFLGTSGDVNPISKAGWHFGRKYLSKYIYGGGDIEGDGTNVKEILGEIKSRLADMVETFSGPNRRLKTEEIARRFVPEKSWMRLCEPTEHKKGGGCRVKQIAMTDEWAAMNGFVDPIEGSDQDRYYNQKYGQQYSYTLEDGGSSGVATYEPIGSKENPLVQPVFVNVNRLLAPDEENYMEKPFGESFFPNPMVTYSRISVKNLERVDDDDLSKVVKKHATGQVVTEFYTSKDYPVITDQTKLEPKEDGNDLIASLLQVNVVKHLTLSQGYLIHLNDMNGKMKSQRVYAEGQEKAISGVDYIYDHRVPENPDDWLAEDNFNLTLDNRGGLDNTVMTLNPSGTISLKDIGVEYNIVNDFREMRSVTEIAGMNINAAFYTIGPIPIAIPVSLPDYARHADQLRIATTTKIINTYGILRTTVAYDAGASVATRNLLWDSETGAVLVTETVNEYEDKYYSMNYPAHWYYKGMGQAAFNSGMSCEIVPGAGIGKYKTTDGLNASTYFSKGDELLMHDETGFRLGWVDEVPDLGTDFDLIDINGNDLVLTGDIYMRIIRSGRRNIQTTSMGSLVMMENPIGLIQGAGGTITNDLFDSEDWDELKVVNAGAVEFRENWDLQCECGIDSENDSYNPYRYNMLGVWRASRSHLYLTGRHHNDGNPDPRNDGFYSSYNPFYKLNGLGEWKISADIDETWTFTSEVTQFSPYGFELENADALNRYSAAQYGYNFSFPLAVAANSQYSEMGFDGFEDYDFDGCPDNEHFGFRAVEPGDPENPTDEGINSTTSHTGKYSLKVARGTSVMRLYRLGCIGE